jgi:hypothetical protein
MLRNRFITSALSVTVLLPLFSCGATVCFTGSSPQITSVTPASVVAGSSSVQVTIVGSHFSDGTVLILNDGTQIAPVTVTASRMTVFFAASFFNGVGTIQFHLSDSCGGSSSTVAISVVGHF